MQNVAILSILEKLTKEDKIEFTDDDPYYSTKENRFLKEYAEYLDREVFHEDTYTENNKIFEQYKPVPTREILRKIGWID